MKAKKSAPKKHSDAAQDIALIQRMTGAGAGGPPPAPTTPDMGGGTMGGGAGPTMRKGGKVKSKAKSKKRKDY